MATKKDFTPNGASLLAKLAGRNVHQEHDVQVTQEVHEEHNEQYVQDVYCVHDKPKRREQKPARINMAFQDEVLDYITTMAATMKVSKTRFVNDVILAHKAAHIDKFRKAEQLIADIGDNL